MGMPADQRARPSRAKESSGASDAQDRSENRPRSGRLVAFLALGASMVLVAPTAGQASARPGLAATQVTRDCRLPPPLCAPENDPPTAGAADDDLFSYTMALQGDTAVIGAPRDSTAAGEWAGSAYVYVRGAARRRPLLRQAQTLTDWSLQATLLPPNQGDIDNFGRSVDLDGDTLVVGAPRVAIGEEVDAGAAYVFVRSGTTWSLQATLTHPTPQAVDAFGRWAAVSGDTVAVSAPLDDTAAGVDAGSVFVFVRSGTTWSLQATVLSPTPRAGNRFGKALDLEGQTMLIGEPQSPGSGGAAKVGSAHVFVGAGASWSLQETLIHPSPKADDHFGRWVSVSGDTTLVSAPSDDTSAGTNAGSGHVFVRSGTDWSFQATLLPPDQRAGDNFGLRAILVGDTAAIGAPKDDTGAGDSAGRAFVFVRSGTTWSVQATLLSPTPKAGDLFGRGFGLDGTTLFVAEPYDDNATGKNAGAAHVFGRVDSAWSPTDSIIDPNTTPT